MPNAAQNLRFASSNTDPGRNPNSAKRWAIGIPNTDLRNFVRDIQLDNLTGHRIAPLVINSLPSLLNNLFSGDLGRTNYVGVWGRV
jgi:hypothetical protein